VPIHVRAETGDFADACLLPGDPLRARYIAETYLEDAVQVNGERGLLGFQLSACCSNIRAILFCGARSFF
jgi:purine-nucleoside phosphorylase